MALEWFDAFMKYFIDYSSYPKKASVLRMLSFFYIYLSINAEDPDTPDPEVRSNLK